MLCPVLLFFLHSLPINYVTELQIPGSDRAVKGPSRGPISQARDRTRKMAAHGSISGLDHFFFYELGSFVSEKHVDVSFVASSYKGGYKGGPIICRFPENSFV